MLSSFSISTFLYTYIHKKYNLKALLLLIIQLKFLHTYIHTYNLKANSLIYNTFPSLLFIYTACPITLNTFKYIHNNMSKRHTVLYVDGNLVAEAKAKGINLSRLFESMLEAELGYIEIKKDKTQEDVIRELNMRITNLLELIKSKDEQLKELRKQITKLKEENERLSKEKDKLERKETVFERVVKI